jgi:hypothetical protein
MVKEYGKVHCKIMCIWAIGNKIEQKGLVLILGPMV